MSKPLVPTFKKTPEHDLVYTPDDLAEKIVRHFNPRGRILEPCRGGGAFTRAMPNADWCEIQEGRDFLSCSGLWDWAITNPPWSQLRPFLKKSMEVADNVVFLCLINAFFMRARIRDMEQAGFGFREIVFLDTPKAPWPQTGFQLGAIFIQRGATGPVKFSKLAD